MFEIYKVYYVGAAKILIDYTIRVCYKDTIPLQYLNATEREDY